MWKSMYGRWSRSSSVLPLFQAGEDHQEHQREDEREHAAPRLRQYARCCVADLPGDEPEVPGGACFGGKAS